MVGDIINNNDIKKLKDITNKAELYDKFIDTMYEVYNAEKKKTDVNIPANKRDLENQKKILIKKHEEAALLEVFSEKVLLKFKWDIRNKCKDFLEDISNGEEKAGLIMNIVDGKPRFIHRTVAEYFCGLWFSKHNKEYHEFVKNYELPSEVDFHMSCKLNDLHEFFKFILMRKQDDIKLFLDTNDSELDIEDPLGRDVLYYVERYLNMNDLTKYNIISRLYVTNSIVQKMYGYHYTTQVMLNLHLLSSFLYNLDKQNQDHQSLIQLIFYWLITKSSKSVQHYVTFKYEIILYFYIQFCRHLPLHVAVIDPFNDLSIGSILSEQNINSKDDLGLTALHLAAVTGNEHAIKLLCEHDVEYSNNNVLRVYPHQFPCDMSRNILKLFHKAAAIIEEEDILIANIKTEDYVAQILPLHDAVQKNDLNCVKKESVEFNRVDSSGRTALHVAAACNIDNKEIYDHLFNNNIIYTRDKHGLYAHDYCRNSMRFTPVLDYGIKRHLANLPESRTRIFGICIENIILGINRII